MAAKKPLAKGTHVGDNVFGVMGACVLALKDAGQDDKVELMKARVRNSRSYEEALECMQEFCKFA